MRLEQLREIVRRVLAEDVEGGQYAIGADDIDAIFDDEFNDYVVRHGVKVFAPYRMRSKFKSHTQLAKLALAYGFDPQDAAHVFKKGDNKVLKPQFRKLKAPPKTFDEREQVAVVLTLRSEGDRARLLDRMASRIVQHFQRMGITEVMPVDSSYGMSRDLAERVAAGLGVPIEASVEKETDPGAIAWDFDEFERWAKDDAPANAAAKGQPLEVYLDNMLKWLDATDKKHLVSLIKKGRKPSIARDIPNERRKFWNLFKKIEAGGAKRVLVVDDNTASGWTAVHAGRRLKAAGAEAFFAVGYVW